MSDFGAAVAETLAKEGPTIQRLYSVYDGKAQRWVPPFSQLSDEDAKLSFAAFCQEEDCPFDPADLTLYYVGDWDWKMGAMIPGQEVNLGNGIYFKRRQEPPEINSTKGKKDVE